MIYPQIDPEKWAKMYNLNIEPKKCLGCGKLLEKTIPFAEGAFRGLMSAPHGCSPSFDHKVFRSVDKSDNQILKELLAISTE